MNMSIMTMINVWLGDPLGARLMSAEEKRGRYSAFKPRESVLTGVGMGG